MPVLERIELRPAARPRGGLLEAGSTIDGEWWRGVTFSGNGCAEPVLRGPCDNDIGTGGPATDVAGSPGGVETFVPVTVRQGVSCSALSGVDVSALSQERLAYAREWAAGHILQTGDHTEHEIASGTVDNPALVDATDVDTDVLPPIDGLACLEQSAADNLFGGLAFVHASPLIATHLLAASAIWRDGTRWRTVAGSVVVVSPGYSGSELFITGEVYTASGQGQNSSPEAGLDRADNTLTVWADELVLAVFDPCWFGRVTVDVTLCDETT